MPTIYDIAKKAGVSPGTVSKVFNNYSQINEKTKEKVLKIAREMHYMPNPAASSLKTKQSFLVGVIFSENVGIGLDHPFFSKVLEFFRHKMGEYGYDTVFINNTLGNNEIGYLEHCKLRNVDGVFIITALMDELSMVKLIESKIKCVTTDMLVKQRPYVMSDNIGGGKMAVEYLHNMGHKRIAHLAGPLETISAGERLVGYQEALKALDMPFQEEYLVEADMFSFDAGYQATQELINRFEGKEMPTGLFVASDMMAIAALRAFRDRGIRVPEDVSIVGFDDIEVARSFIPALTTIRQDTKAIGEAVAHTLYRLIKEDILELDIPRIPVSLVERETVISYKPYA